MTTTVPTARPAVRAPFADGVDAAPLERADAALHQLLATEEGRADPYPLYRQLRELAPLYRSGLDGLWYASRYDDCKAILVDPRCGRSRGGVPARYAQTR